VGIADGMFTNSVTSISAVSRDRYGDFTASLLYTNQPCRWQERAGVVFSKTTEERRYEVEMWIASSCQIDVDYQVVKGNETYIVVNVIHQYGIEGVKDHIKVFLA